MKKIVLGVIMSLVVGVNCIWIDSVALSKKSCSNKKNVCYSENKVEDIDIIKIVAL